MYNLKNKNFKVFFTDDKKFEIVDISNLVQFEENKFFYFFDSNYIPVKVYDSVNLYDKNDVELFYGCDIVRLVLYTGYEDCSVCSATHDVIEGRDSTRYEYVGILLKDNFENPYLYDLENDKILFYLINLDECDKYEFEVLNTIHE